VFRVHYAREERGIGGKRVWNSDTGNTRPARPNEEARAALLDLASQAVHHGAAAHCLILHGPIGSGKTTTARRLAQTLAAEGVAIGGVLAPRLVESGSTVGYAVEDLATGERRPLASLQGRGVPAGRYILSEDGLEFAHKAIERALSAVDVVFVDEVGRLELDGGGHAASVQAAIDRDTTCVLLVRSGLIDRVLERFGIAGALVLRVDRPVPESQSGSGVR
jgi:nucleoside-triphosphatase THEP1